MPTKLVPILVGLACAAIVTIAIVVRTGSQKPTPPRPPKPDRSKAALAPPASAPVNKPPDLVYDAPTQTPPPATSKEESGAAIKRGMIKTHLRTYRHAVLRNNRDAQLSLLEALRKKELAIQIAQEELAEATTDKVQVDSYLGSKQQYKAPK